MSLYWPGWLCGSSVPGEKSEVNSINLRAESRNGAPSCEKRASSTSVSASLIAGFRGSHYGFPGANLCSIRWTRREGWPMRRPDVHLGGLAYGRGI